MSITTALIDILDRWLIQQETGVGNHVLVICNEKDGSRDDVLDQLREIVRSHYVAPEVTAKRIEELGAPATAQLLSQHLPTTKTARSGDLGEILATEFAERRLAFQVPIRRLRYKDGRNVALRGDDIVATALDAEGRVSYLKGEAKSRSSLDTSVVSEASEALDRDAGHPGALSVLFVAERLRDQGEDGLALELEKAVAESFQGRRVEHLLFTVSGNCPHNCLSAHADCCPSEPRRYVVGVQITAHGEFIERLFQEM